MIDHDFSQVLDMVAPDGTICRSHTVPVEDENMITPLHANMVMGATHVVTIHARVNPEDPPVRIRPGDIIVLDGEELQVLASYDPYVNPGVELPDDKGIDKIRDPVEKQARKEANLQEKSAAKQSLEEQIGKWLKILIRLE